MVAAPNTLGEALGAGGVDPLVPPEHPVSAKIDKTSASDIAAAL